MTRRKIGSRWRVCPGCGHERRLAPDGRVMCRHNRWEPAVRAMVPCEGSGHEPGSDSPPADTHARPTLPDVVPARGGAQPSRPARQGAA